MLNLIKVTASGLDALTNAETGCLLNGKGGMVSLYCLSEIYVEEIWWTEWHAGRKVGVVYAASLRGRIIIFLNGQRMYRNTFSEVDVWSLFFSKTSDKL